MLYVSGKIVNPIDAIYTVEFPTIKNHRLLYIQRNDGAKVEVIRNKKVYSIVPDPFAMVVEAKKLMIPVMSDIEEKVTANIYETASIYTTVITAIYAEKDEIKDNDLGLKAYTDTPDTVNIDDYPVMVEIYKNRTSKPQNIWGISVVGQGIEEFIIYVGTEKIASSAIMAGGGLFGNDFIPMAVINKSLLPGQTVKINFTMAAYGGGAAATGFVWITNKPRMAVNLPYISRNVDQTLQMIPPKPTITDILKPTILPEPPLMPIRIPPYPVPPDKRNIISQTTPRTISLLTTMQYSTPNNLLPTQLNLPNEQRTIEALPNPFGVVRKSADAMGRLRTTGAAITYTNNTLSVTDAVAHTVWTGYGSKKITLRATAEDWTIKVLPLYDWLSGKAITDMGDITLKAGQQIQWDLETREIQATCPTGSETATGTLDWEMDV